MDTQKRTDYLGILVKYRIGLVILCTVIYLYSVFSNGGEGLLRKLWIALGMVISCLLAAYLYQKVLNNGKPTRWISVVICAEIFVYGVFTFLSGGFSSPYFWCYVGYLITSMAVHKSIPLTVLGMVWCMFCAVISARYIPRELFKVETNLALGTVIIAGTFYILLHYLTLEMQHLSVYRDLNLNLTREKFRSEQALKHATSLYEAINLFAMTNPDKIMEELCDTVWNTVAPAGCVLIKLAPDGAIEHQVTCGIDEQLACRAAAVAIKRSMRELQSSDMFGWDAYSVPVGDLLSEEEEAEAAPQTANPIEEYNEWGKSESCGKFEAAYAFESESAGKITEAGEPAPTGKITQAGEQESTGIQRLAAEPKPAAESEASHEFEFMKIGWNFPHQGLLLRKKTERDEVEKEQDHIYSGLVEIVFRNISIQRQLEEYIIAEEQHRLANGIHDTVIQKLFGIASSLKILEITLETTAPEIQVQQVQKVQEIRRSVETTMKELREAIYGLDFGTDQDGFNHKLANYMSEVENLTGTAVQLKLDDNAGEMSLAQKIAAYRISCEAVNNAVRHGNAQCVGITIGLVRDMIQIIISDNGAGFSYITPATPTSGKGLRNMRQIVSMLGGKFEINSQKGVGTTVCAMLPR